MDPIMNRYPTLLIPTILLILSTGICSARSAYQGTWNFTYPDTASNDSISCNLCHSSGGGNGWNAYGWEMRQEFYTRGSLPEAIQAIESIDSDGDGSTNLEEIEAGTQPGWTEGNNNTFFYKNGYFSTGNALLGSILNADPEVLLTIFEAWIASFGLSSSDLAMDADPDQDGHSNLEEFAFGGLPNDATSHPRLTVTPNSGNNPSFTIDVRLDDSSLTITPSWSNDLNTAFSPTNFTTASDSSSPFGSEYVRRTFNTSLTDQNTLFFRAEAQISE